MKYIDPRSLLDNEIKKIDINEEMLKTFNQYIQLLKDNGNEYSELDIFMAGYIISNPTVRDKYKNVRSKEIPYDNRIQNQLWR